MADDALNEAIKWHRDRVAQMAHRPQDMRTDSLQIVLLAEIRDALKPAATATKVPKGKKKAPAKPAG